MQELFTQLPCSASFLRISLVFFSTSFLAIMIWCPQPKHFNLKSAPTRRISHSLLPHGCCFFNLTISPTSYSNFSISVPTLCLYCLSRFFLIISSAVHAAGTSSQNRGSFPIFHACLYPDLSENLSQSCLDQQIGTAVHRRRRFIYEHQLISTVIIDQSCCRVNRQ